MFFIFYYVGLLYTCFAVFLAKISVLVPMFIIQGLLNTPSLVLYGSRNRLKTCEWFALLEPWIPMQRVPLTTLLPFYRMRRLFVKPHTEKKINLFNKNLCWITCSNNLRLTYHAKSNTFSNSNMVVETFNWKNNFF